MCVLLVCVCALRCVLCVRLTGLQSYPEGNALVLFLVVFTDGMSTEITRNAPNECVSLQPTGQD